MEKRETTASEDPRETVRGAAMSDVDVLEETVAAQLTGDVPKGLVRRARQSGARLAESLEGLGHGEIAHEVRAVVGSLAAVTTPHDPALPELAALMLAVRDHVEQVVPGSVSAPADAVASNETIVILAADEQVRLALSVAAIDRGSHVVAVRNIRELAEKMPPGGPGAILVDLSSAQGWKRKDLERQLASPSCPIVVVGDGNTFHDRSVGAALRATRFFDRTASPRLIMDGVLEVMTFNQTLTGETPRVLVVDSDQQCRERIRLLLQPSQIEVIALDDVSGFWPALESVSPDLVIINQEWPNTSGSDICRSLRADGRWRSLPVLILVDELDNATVTRVFEARADDLVRKPIVGPEVVARVCERLERRRLYRQLTELDPITGATNQARALETLERYVREGRRDGEPVSLGVIRVDRFQELNKRYGRVLGDEILSRCAAMLRATFRHEDVVARWGGAEFVVGMYGMPQGVAAGRLLTARDAFYESTFEVGNTPLHLGLTAAVAEYPAHGKTVEALYHAADTTVQHAQAIGSNQILRAGWRLPHGLAEFDVLLIEGDEILSRLLEQSLGFHGLRAARVANADEAERRINSRMPYVAVVDMDVTGSEGYDILQQLQAMGRRAIVLGTGLGENQILKALDLGAVDYVSKPFSLPVVVERIRRTVRQARGPEEQLPDAAQVGTADLGASAAGF